MYDYVEIDTYHKIMDLLCNTRGKTLEILGDDDGRSVTQGRFSFNIRVIDVLEYH